MSFLQDLFYAMRIGQMTGQALNSRPATARPPAQLEGIEFPEFVAGTIWRRPRTGGTWEPLEYDQFLMSIQVHDPNEMIEVILMMLCGQHFVDNIGGYEYAQGLPADVLRGWIQYG